MLRRLGLFIAFLFAASIAQAAPRPPAWNQTVTAGAAGWTLGNPQAPVKVTQYSAYTCPFCAAFAVEAEAPLRLFYVGSGRVSFEVRQVLLSPVDLTVAMLVECGPRDRYFLNHVAFLRSQPRWRQALHGATRSQSQRWTQGPLIQRNRAIAGDLKLYAFMEGRGMGRMEVDRCLGDQAAADRIRAESEASLSAGIEGVPSFAINGNVLPNVNNWSQLRPMIDKSLTEQ